MVFPKNTTSTGRNPRTACRAPTGQGKRGAERWGERGGDGQSPLNTSRQLGVNNDSVQVGLYCFWLQAFYRNNCNFCQGSFCPQLRGKNKEQRWECLHLILVPRNTQEGQQAWLPMARARVQLCPLSAVPAERSPACFRHPSSLCSLTPVVGTLLVFPGSVGGGMGAPACVQKSDDNFVDLVQSPG